MSKELTTRRGDKVAVIEQRLGGLDVVFDVSDKLVRIRFGTPTAPPAGEWPALFTKATNMISTGAIAGMAQALATVSRPADLTEVARSLATLIAGYPMVQKSELAAFAELLAADVFELGASAYAIMTACKKLRRTSKFLPSISETLAAIEEESGRIHCGRYIVEKFANYRLSAFPVARRSTGKRCPVCGRRASDPCGADRAVWQGGSSDSRGVGGTRTSGPGRGGRARPGRDTRGYRAGHAGAGSFQRRDFPTPRRRRD